MSRQLKIAIGLLSLVGVLAYNFTHTGGLLASYVNPAFVGYVAAFGIELAVVGLSLRIDELRRHATDARFHVSTLAAVVVVSALANIAEGYHVKFGEALTASNIGRLDIVQAIVSLSATGLLSLVVFALAEVVGHDIGSGDWKPVTLVSNAPQSIAPGTPANSTPELESTSVMAIDGPETPVLPVDKSAAILDYYRVYPQAKQAEVAQAVGVTRQYVSTVLRNLEESGKIRRNGQVEVVD